MDMTVQNLEQVKINLKKTKKIIIENPQLAIRRLDKIIDTIDSMIEYNPYPQSEIEYIFMG